MNSALQESHLTRFPFIVLFGNLDQLSTDHHFSLLENNHLLLNPYLEYVMNPSQQLATCKEIIRQTHLAPRMPLIISVGDPMSVSTNHRPQVDKLQPYWPWLFKIYAILSLTRLSI